MKHGRLLAVLCAVFALAACGIKKDKKDAENMEREAREKQRTVLVTNIQLSFNGVEIGGDKAPVEPKWLDKTPEQREDLRKKLVLTKNAAGRLLEIGNHKNMKWEKGSGPGYYQKTVNDAIFHLESLRKFEVLQGQQMRTAPAPQRQTAPPVQPAPSIPKTAPAPGGLQDA